MQLLNICGIYNRTDLKRFADLDSASVLRKKRPTQLVPIFRSGFCFSI
jgi:hypothetical protein